jgi:hypothetical protein
MSTAFFPQGTKLYRKNPATDEYQEITQVVVTNFGSVAQEFDDITNHSSPAGFREKVATIKDPGTIACQLIFDPANLLHRQLFADNAAGTLLSWRITIPTPSSSKTEFDAYVTGLNNPAQETRAMRLDFSLERSGQPTFTW